MARTIHCLLAGLCLLGPACLNAQAPAQSGSVETTLGQATAPMGEMSRLPRKVALCPEPPTSEQQLHWLPYAEKRGR